MNRQPPPMEVCTDPNALARRAAEVVRTELSAAIEERGEAVLVLAGGSTPKGLYEELAARPAGVDWTKVWFVWGDERCVPPDDPQSNVRLATETLLQPLGIDDSRVLPPRTRLEPGEAADAYGITLRGLFDDQSPHFDLVLLGLGEDGHTASLFPGGPELELPDSRLVTASRSPKPPHDRISLTLGALNRARSVLFLVQGASKAPALRGVMEGDFALPAARVRPKEGRLLWLVENTSVEDAQDA